MKHAFLRSDHLVLVAAMAASVGQLAYSANGTWNSSAPGSNAFWTNNVNWSASPSPAGNQTATFNNSGNGRTTVDLTGLAFGVSNIVFDTASVAAYTLGSNGVNQQALVFTNSSNLRMSASSVNGQRVDALVLLGHDRATSSHTFRNDQPYGALTLAGNITATSSVGTAGTKTLTVAGIGTVTVSGDISPGSASAVTLTDTSLGSVLVTGSNRVTTVNANGGPLFLTGTNRIDTVNVNAAGPLNLSGTNIVTTLNINGSGNSVINITAGALVFSNGGGPTLIASQDAVINGPGVIVLPTGPSTNPMGDNSSAAGKTFVINASLTGNAGLELWSGTGTFILNGINTFTENVMIGPACTLAVSKIGLARSADSNLGRGTNISFNASGSRLLYTGTGETSDRILNFKNSGIVDQSGEGNLKFVTPVTGVNTRTVTLQGSTAGTGEFSGALRNDLATLAINKAGTGMWTLSTNNTYTGATTVNGGTLALSGAYGAIASSASITLAAGATLLLSNAPGASNANRLGDAAAITLNGGTLRFDNAGGGASYSESAGAVAVSQSASTIAAAPAAAGQTSTLRLASLTRAAGASVDFSGAGLGLDDRNRIFITAQADGLIGAWATVNGTNFAAYSSAAGVYAAPGSAFTDIAARGDTIVDSAASAVRINTDGTVGPIQLSAATTRVASLLQNTATAATLDTAGKTFQTTSILVPSDKASVTVGSAANDGSLAPLAANGELALANDSVNALTINAVVADNGASPKLSKYGSGAATLAAANTFSGQVTVYGGSLILANSDALQNVTLSTTGTVFDSSVASHAFSVGNLSGTYDLPLSDNDGAPNAVALTVGGKNTDAVYGGALSGEGSLTKTGSGSLTLSGANRFLGGLTIQQGTVVASNAFALGIGGLVNNGLLFLPLTGATYYYSGISNSMSGAGTVNVWLATGSSTTYLNGDYSGFTGVWNIGTNAVAGASKVMMNGADNAAATVNILANGTVMCTGSGTHQASVNLYGGDIGEAYGQLRLENGAEWAGPVALKAPIAGGADAFLGCNGGLATISGTISDGGAGYTVDKIGGGTLYLPNTNTFSGPFWIKGGNVRVDTIGSVNSGASPLGNPTSEATATLKLGYGTTSGGLIYSGMGETTDRTLDLAGTSGGGTISHNGTNNLVFTGNVVSSVSGAKQLRLQGLTNALGTIAGVIQDTAFANAVNVYKDGFGVWTLSNTNLFTGQVEINQGSLIITTSDSLGVGVKSVRASNGTAGNPQLHLAAPVGESIILGSNFTFYTSNQTDGSIHNDSGDNVIAGNFSMTSGGGGTIIDSHADKITLSGYFTPDQSGRLLTLRGDGDGEIAGVVRDGGTTGMSVTRDRGAGTWTFSNTNAFTGTLNVNSGTVALDGQAGALASAVAIGQDATFTVNNNAFSNNADRLKDTRNITLSGGVLAYAHTGGATDYSEAAGALIVATGTNTLLTSQADEGQSSTLTFASLAQAAGLLNFVGPGLGEGARNKILFATPPPAGLIGLWARYNTNSYASYDSTLGVVAASLDTFTAIPAKGPYSVTNEAALVARITADGTEGPLALDGTPASSLKALLQDSAFASTIGMTNQTLQVSDIMIAPAGAALTLGTAADEGAITPLTAGGTVTLINQSGSTLTLNAPITNNTSASSVSKLGAGNVVLNGTNTYTGPTVIGEGPLEFGGGATQKLSGVISGNGALVKSGSGRLFLAAINSYMGQTTVKEGTLMVYTNSALGNTLNGTVIEAGATLDVGGNLGVNGLNLGAEVVTVSGSGVNGRGAIVNSSDFGQANALRFVTLAGDTTFGGESSAGRWDIRNTATPATLTMNEFDVTKVGSNYVGLTSINVLPGADSIITVAEGSLTLESATVMNGTLDNAVAVQSGATLDLYRLAAPPEWSLSLGDGARVYTRSSTGPTQNKWAGPATFSGLAIFEGANNTTNTIAGDISGAGSLVKIGSASGSLFLTSSNNTYNGSTAISNGTLYAKYAGSLPGYDSGKVTLAGGATLAISSGDGQTGWSGDQLQALHDTSAFLTNTALLSVDAALNDLACPGNLTKPFALLKQGNRTLTLAGNSTFSGAVTVSGGSLVFGNAHTTSVGAVTINGGSLTFGDGSTNIVAGAVTVKGGAVGATLNMSGAVSLRTSSDNLAVATSANDRSIVRSTANLACYAVRMSEGATPMASAFYNDGGNIVSTRLLLALTAGAGNYSYYRHNGGVAAISEFLEVGTYGIGVMDVLSGTIAPNGTAYASISRRAGSIGVLNVFGGTVHAPSNGNAFEMSRSVDGANPNACLNVFGSGVLNAATGTGTTKTFNMNVGTNDSCLSVINLIDGGTLIANKIGYSKLGDRRVNFDGGVLMAAPGTTVGATFLQGLTAAAVYPGGATIDTTNANITVNQSLLAPTGYGISSITLLSGGAGYIGRPAVVLSGGAGTGATAIASVNLSEGSPTFGRVTGFTVTCPGTGYLPGDAVTVALRGGGYTNAQAYAVAVLSPNASSGGLSKLGSGTLTLGGDNTYGGATTLSAGTLRLAHAQALPTGTQVTLAGGTLDLNGLTVTNTLNTAGAISGTLSNGVFQTVLSPAGEHVIGSQTFSVATPSAALRATYHIDVAADGSSDLLAVQGDINLSNIALNIVDTDGLDRLRQYPILTCTGTRTGTFSSANFPDTRWGVFHAANGDTRLIFSDGLLLILR